MGGGSGSGAGARDDATGIIGTFILSYFYAYMFKQPLSIGSGAEESEEQEERGLGSNTVLYMVSAS